MPIFVDVNVPSRKRQISSRRKNPDDKLFLDIYVKNALSKDLGGPLGAGTLMSLLDKDYKLN